MDNSNLNGPEAGPQTKPEPGNGSLWQKSPAWRNLIFGTISLTAVAVTVPLLSFDPSALSSSGDDDHNVASRSAQNETGCYTSPAPVQLQTVRGLVVGFLTREQAIAMMKRTQAAAQKEISPQYVMQQRVKVHVDGSPEGFWLTVVLPEAMTAKLGDRVEYIRSHTDSENPCHYVPNLVAKVNPAG